jgi:DNA repair exonuclease SbcCD nuclease subunit
VKVGFTADIHIKLGQKNVPIDWAKDRYAKLWNQLAEGNDHVDLWVLGGDVFDKMPSVEELEVYFDMLTLFKKPTRIIPGNHESVKKNTTFLTNLKSVTNRINPLVRIIDDFHTEDGIDYIPYNKLKEYHPSDIDFHSNILVTHVRGEIPPHVKPEVPLELFDRWEVVLAGDLHSYTNSQRNILYPGSPVTTSFHRDTVDTGFIILDTESLEHQWVQFDLPQLIRKTIKAGEEMTPGTYHHVIYEVEGDMSELGAIKDSTLIDKKVAKRSSDTALILTPEMSLNEEVKEYLLYVLELSEKTVEDILQELNNHANTIH